ncbi:uncharacterized protein KGF55_005769 [Candida pseudojiufengensis]|uniref:uncharacterized protein n=1 Tax=Candida pseudojiufengensis TaxID=497109 RepID=UPI0022242FEB|nr:uncharacterized protein KGF55_005769 [Candida pseudojiufengensis]KAI5958509.1 hypothetical protein KGF55_005769 [Candida pseudojiufengensis]
MANNGSSTSLNHLHNSQRDHESNNQLNKTIDQNQRRPNNDNNQNQKSKYHKYSKSNSIWIFPETIVLNNTPSRLDKRPISLSHELRLKESIHEFLIRLGTKLKVDGPTILATTVYLHRFYMRVPITGSKYFVTSAAFALSCKLNDNYRQPDKISLISCNLKNPLQPIINQKTGQKLPPPVIDEQSKIYWEWKDQLLFREEIILRKLNFDLNFKSPYLFQFKILNKIHLGMGEKLYLKKKEIIKSTINLIEILSSLPIILCFDIIEIFATCFIIIIVENNMKNKIDNGNENGNRIENQNEHQNDNNNDIKLSSNFINDILDTDQDVILHCFQFIKHLLKICQEDQKFISNKIASKRILPIKTAQIMEIITS